ncbi:DUF2313 domain-containing protein [Cronobacter sakazakii]|nr:DUF2313 domain-containing protein [Cronobacter sakazakii]
MAVEDEYTRLLKRLLPPGPAWEGNNPLLEGLAPSLARVHAQSSALMREIDPGAAVQLLDRYEALCGLPDECTIEETQTLSQRQRRLAAKINGYGGINEAFYRRQLDALGYRSVSITQYQNEAENPRPDIATDDDYRYLWQVNIPTLATIDVMTCASSCVDSLRTWGDTVIECVINKLAPSHTEAVFAYTE